MKFEYTVVPDAAPSKPFAKVIEVDPKHLAEVEQFLVLSEELKKKPQSEKKAK